MYPDKSELEIMGFTCLENIIVHQGRPQQRVLNILNLFFFSIIKENCLVWKKQALLEFLWYINEKIIKSLWLLQGYFEGGGGVILTGVEIRTGQRSQKQPLVNRMLVSNRTTELFSLCLRFKRTLLKLTSSSSSFDFPLVEALLLILSFQSFFTIYEIVFEKQLESLQFTSTSLIYLHYPGSS